MKKLIGFLVVGLLFASSASAEVVTYEGVGQYVMSDFETPEVAKLRAQQRAEKSAQEKAGIFVKTNTKVVNLQLESEEVEVMTAGIMKVKSVTHDVQTAAEGFIFTAKVLVDIDTDEIDKWLEKSVVEKEQLREQNKSLQKTLAAQEAELAALKEKLSALENKNPAEAFLTKIQLQGSFMNADADFLSNNKLAEGLDCHRRGNLPGAINFYTQALDLNKNNVAALVWRGNAFGSLGNYQLAAADLSRAIQLDSTNSDAYVGLGLAYYAMQAYAPAISAFNAAIQLAPKSGKLYHARALCFRALGRDFEAQKDFSAAQILGYRN